MDVMLVPDSTELETREWTVVDQKLPIPLHVIVSDLNNHDLNLSLDSLDGSMIKIRRFSSFRAYHGSGYFDAREKKGTSMILCFYRQEVENFKEKHKIIDVPLSFYSFIHIEKINQFIDKLLMGIEGAASFIYRLTLLYNSKMF